MAESSKGVMETVGFRRFLSYIYAYENGRKLRNAGFVKVEIRGQRMKIQVAVNGIYQKGGRPVEIYLVDDRENRISVGEISLLNGHGEFRSSTNTENVWNSGYAFSQICGICLQGAGNKNQYYMTIWKEIKGKALEEEEEKPQRKSEKAEEEKPHRKPEMIYVEKQKAVIEGEEKQNIREGTGEPEVKEMEEVPAEPEVKEMEEEPAEPEVKKMEEEPAEPEVKKMEEEPAEPELKRIEEVPVEPDKKRMEEVPAEPDKIEIDNRPELCEMTKSENSMEQKNPVEAEKQPEPPVLCAAEVNKAEPFVLWKKLCSRYPHVDIRPAIQEDTAFRNGRHICEVLRIRPADIGRLPRNNWILAQNQFVRQAYNRFRQIFLFRMEEGDGPEANQWFMGVPGENNEQERALAKVFGFTDYLQCRNGGFWYTKIYMGE